MKLMGFTQHEPLSRATGCSVSQAAPTRPGWSRCVASQPVSLEDRQEVTTVRIENLLAECSGRFERFLQEEEGVISVLLQPDRFARDVDQCDCYSDFEARAETTEAVRGAAVYYRVSRADPRLVA